MSSSPLQFVSTAAAVLILASACRDGLTTPMGPGRSAPAPAAADVLESPASGSAEFAVGAEAPLAGAEQVIGQYPTTTIVAMTVHQGFTVTRLGDLPGTGFIALPGRISGFGCSHQGEAYLVTFPADGAYGFPFAGCQLAGVTPPPTTFTDTVPVNGQVRYGYSWDSACPFPDYGCASYSGSSGVSIARVPASALTISGDSVAGGVLRAVPTREYGITAAPTPQRMGRYATPVLPVGTGWTFTPDSGAVQADVCNNGSGSWCTKVFDQSGVLTLVALVNGVRMTSNPVRVQMPELALRLSADSVTLGDTVLVSTTVTGLDSTALSYYSVSTCGSTGRLIDFAFDRSPVAPPSLATTSAASMAPDPLAMRSVGDASTGLPPCLGTKPVPTRCYVVPGVAGRAVVEVGARLARGGLAVHARSTVMVSGSRPKLRVLVAADSKALVPFSRHVHAPKCQAEDVDVPRGLRVSVIDERSGAPVPNRRVMLALAAVVPDDPRVADAGGHVPAAHAGTPKPPGRLSQTDVVTDADGDAHVTYSASEFGGRYEVRGTSDGATPGADTVTVGVPLEVLGSGSHYDFIGRTDAHPVSHYGTHVMNTRLALFATQLFAEQGVDIEINDIALPLGGRFEVADRSHPAVAWANPSHCDHRWGRGADLRTNTFQAGYSADDPSPIVRTMQLKWARLSRGFDAGLLPYFWEGDHLHLKTVQ
jgi:hypothetical protein